MEAKRMGRPPKPEAEKRQQIGVRTSPDLKDRLEGAAAANARSVAQEAELRLIQSFDADDLMNDASTKSMFIQMAGEIRRAERATGKAWHQDVTTHRAAAALIKDFLEHHAPMTTNFDALLSARQAIGDLQSRGDILRKLLADYNVIRQSMRLADLLLPGGMWRGFAENPEAEWSDPDGRSLSVEDMDLLRTKLAELNDIQREIDEKSPRFLALGEPYRDAIKKGDDLYNTLRRGNRVGGEDGASV